MHGPGRRAAVVACAWVLVAFAVQAGQAPVRQAAAPAVPLAPGWPTLLLVGDSTVQTPTAGQLGWGTAIAHYFDASKIRVVNRALGGHSSRTFQTEGHWGRALQEITAGDYVLIQFGHSDAGPPSAPPGRPRAQSSR